MYNLIKKKYPHVVPDEFSLKLLTISKEFRPPEYWYNYEYDPHTINVYSSFAFEPILIINSK